jgi:hypothetical protein
MGKSISPILSDYFIQGVRYIVLSFVFIEQTTRAVKVEDEIQESSEEHGYELNGNNLFDY